ncbi:unnamed protein product [Schistocephalus solidus]|uniref:Uncharacterized protein n=1 Tax=Schistocephalus solidus TaxID=70667 RepID=A0A183STI3_SCHSO|nr:unnamed protein product [Schistocephalus solidus]
MGPPLQVQSCEYYVGVGGPLAAVIFAIIAMAMCFGVSTIFVAIFLIGSAALRIREFIIKRRAKSAGIIQDSEAARVGTQAASPYSAGIGPTPMYGAGDGGGGYGAQPTLMDRAVESAAKGATHGLLSGTNRPGVGGYPGF